MTKPFPPNKRLHVSARGLVVSETPKPAASLCFVQPAWLRIGPPVVGTWLTAGGR